MVLMSSCCTTRKAQVSSSINGEWNIVEVNGTKVNMTDDTESPFIGFNVNENRVYGNSGCNRMTGTLSVNTKSKSLNFGNVASTRMACHNMELENRVLEAVNIVSTYNVLKDGSIGLYDKGNKMVMKLEKK